MLANRVFVSGGVSVLHRAVQNGDPRAMVAMADSLGLRRHRQNDVDGLRFLPPRINWGAMAGRVGAIDMVNLPNSDGSPAKVEWLPISGAAGNDVAAAATRDYELKPNKYARPGPLVIDDDVAKNLVMTNLLIGGKPIFAGSGAVPGRFFAHTSVHNALSSYVASSNAPITFTLQNVHASATQTIRGVWVCETAELAVG